MKLNEDEIIVGTKSAQANTWGNRYNYVVPSIKKEGATITFSTSDVSLQINSFDEIILTIIIKFLFMPVWLIKKCYGESIGIAGFEDIDIKINNWIKVGIISKEDSVTGQYVRPTYALFTLFGLDPYPYTSIPFNTLTHTISEEKVMFDIMAGNSDIIKRENIKIPRMSELGFEPYRIGTNVIAEGDFRNPILYTQNGIDELNRVENEINQGIINGVNFTPELENFRYFIIAKKINSTGIPKKDYLFHLPDLVIPLPRINGKSKSIAVEVELTNKRVNYEESLNRYKNNNKYGAVYWLCNSSAIVQSLKAAYEAVGGTGDCRMMLSEFVIPSPDF